MPAHDRRLVDSVAVHIYAAPGEPHPFAEVQGPFELPGGRGGRLFLGRGAAGAGSEQVLSPLHQLLTQRPPSGSPGFRPLIACGGVSRAWLLGRAVLPRGLRRRFPVRRLVSAVRRLVSAVRRSGRGVRVVYAWRAGSLGLPGRLGGRKPVDLHGAVEVRRAGVGEPGAQSGAPGGPPGDNRRVHAVAVYPAPDAGRFRGGVDPNASARRLFEFRAVPGVCVRHRSGQFPRRSHRRRLVRLPHPAVPLRPDVSHPEVVLPRRPAAPAGLHRVELRHRDSRVGAEPADEARHRQAAVRTHALADHVGLAGHAEQRAARQPGQHKARRPPGAVVGDGGVERLRLGTAASHLRRHGAPPEVDVPGAGVDDGRPPARVCLVGGHRSTFPFLIMGWPASSSVSRSMRL